MLVVMTRDATQQDVDGVCDAIRAMGFQPVPMPGEQRTAIETQLSSSSEVRSFVYENKDEAYERFREQFSQQPELVENTPSDALPESFRVELVNPERYAVIAAEFPNGENGVDQVVRCGVRERILARRMGPAIGPGRFEVGQDVLDAFVLAGLGEEGAAGMARAGCVAVLLPGAFYFLRETQKPPVELFWMNHVPVDGRNTAMSVLLSPS